MRPCSSMIAGQPWRGSTSIRSIGGSAPAAVGGRPATDAARAAAAAGAEAAALDVLGDVRRGHAVALGQDRAGDVAPAVRVAAVIPEIARRAVERGVVAVAVGDDPVAAVDAVRGVVASAGPEREREHGDSHQGNVAGTHATAFAHSASSLLVVVDSLIRRSASTTSGCETFTRSLSSS